MKNGKDDVVYSQDALADTISACRIELKTVCSKTPGKGELLVRFITMELHSYLRISLMGLVICVLGSLWFPKEAIVLCCAYMAFLGAIMMMELYRRRRYHVEELFGPVYLNSGRVLWYKMGGIALLEIIEILMITGMLTLIGITEIEYLLLNGFLPLFLIQLLLIWQSERIQDIHWAIGVYIFLFVLYNTLVLANNLLAFVTTSQLLISAGIIIILFYLRLYLSCRTITRRNSHGTDLRTSY